MKQARKHPEVVRDISNAVRFYADTSFDAADRFIREIEVAIARIEKMPGTGSSRFAYDLHIPGLRAYSLHDFPYLIFYFEREIYIDVARVLHAHRDLFNLLLDIE